jgi:chaperonin GroEL
MPVSHPFERVVFQPRVYRTLQQGIRKIVEAVRPTFGPLHGNVLVERVEKSNLPDLLDDGGTIARRIIELPDRDEDVGAMMVRHLMWRMHERYGDATVTAALIYQSIFDQGVRYVLTGGNAMLLRRFLDKGAQRVLEALSRETIPLKTRDQMNCLATTLCSDPEIASRLGEAFMHIGQFGQLEIKSGRGRESRVELINGMVWKGEFFLRSMIADSINTRSELEEPAVLVSNLIIADPYELAEWLAMINQSGITKLLLLAKDISPDCLSVLEATRRTPEQLNVVAVKIWETSERWELQDLSILTGGWMFAREAGYSLRSVKREHLGTAKQAWVEKTRFGIIDGAGDPEVIKRHAHQMLTALERSQDVRLKRKLQERIAAFTAKSAVLWIGGSTQTEIEARKKMADRTATILRGAIADGVLPGGAIALVECLPSLDKMTHSEDLDERTAGRIISNALQMPLNLLIQNSGENPSSIRAAIKRRGRGFGFEVHGRKVMKMQEAGVYDVANAVKAAAYGGITAAALGLTVEVVVHPKKRKESFTTS